MIIIDLFLYIYKLNYLILKSIFHQISAVFIVLS